MFVHPLPSRKSKIVWINASLQETQFRSFGDCLLTSPDLRSSNGVVITKKAVLTSQHGGRQGSVGQTVTDRSRFSADGTNTLSTKSNYVMNSAKHAGADNRVTTSAATFSLLQPLCRVACKSCSCNDHQTVSLARSEPSCLTLALTCLLNSSRWFHIIDYVTKLCSEQAVKWLIFEDRRQRTSVSA